MALRRLSEAGSYNPVDVAFFWDDFIDEYALTSSEPVTGTSPWIGTALASGTTAFANDVNGGTCILSGNATSDNSGSQIQLDTESFAVQASKDLAFGCRFQMSEATDNHFFAGLGITDTTFLDGADGTAALANTASLGFFKPDDGATLYLVAGNGASTIVAQTAVLTVAAATWYTAEFVYRGSATAGNGSVDVYINKNYITTVNITGASTTEMAITLASVSGSATGTISSTFDWVYAASER